MSAKWKAGLGVALIAATLAFPAVAQDGKKKPHGADEVKQDIADHRAMAEAHLNAAKCLESGKPENDCLEKLRQDCKGLGIGKYCGLRHQH